MCREIARRGTLGHGFCAGAICGNENLVPGLVRGSRGLRWKLDSRFSTLRGNQRIRDVDQHEPRAWIDETVPLAGGARSQQRTLPRVDVAATASAPGDG